MKKTTHSPSGWHAHRSPALAAILTLLMLTAPSPKAEAQEVDWKVNFDYLFDNTEFAHSTYARSGTLHAIMLRPIVGLKWAERHSLYGGIHLKKIPGTDKVIDHAELTLYYDYNSGKSHFRAGAFPRADVLPQYWTQFYSSGYRTFNNPQMHGFFYQLGRRSGSYINTWLDWIGYASEDRRENFLFGFSGQLKHGIFFADFQSYVHHLACTTIPVPEGVSTVQGQALLQSTAGISISKPNSLSALLAVGVLAGFERDRATDRRYNPVGFVARANAEYWGIGTRNLTYIGKPQMNMYEDFGSQLYLATSFFKGSFYHRNDIYINLLQSNNVKAELASIQHFSEGRVHFQQTLTLNISLDKSTAKNYRTDKYSFPWKRIFE